MSDARYTAEIFQRMKLSDAQRMYSVDYFQNPQRREDEIHLVYDTHSKYVSKEFNSKEEAMSDKDESHLLFSVHWKQQSIY